MKHAERGQHVVDVEFADERQLDGVRAIPIEREGEAPGRRANLACSEHSDPLHLIAERLHRVAEPRRSFA